MAGLEATATAFSVKISSSFLPSNPLKLHLQPFPSLIHHKTSFFTLRLNSVTVTNSVVNRTHSSANDVALGELEEVKSVEISQLEEVKPVDINQKRKLYVVNLPPFVSGPFVTKIFSQCGVVQEVEIIKEKDGRSRGYAFVTMASYAQAQSAIDKFNNQKVAGRTVRVQYAKQFKKPTPPRNLNIPPASETRYKLYVSNLAFKARSNHLREFFAAVSNPVSARVVFDGPLGRSIGYGFVSFSTKEEAEAALTALNGQELMGRPICIQLSEKNTEERPGDKQEEDSTAEEQPNDASMSETDMSKFLLDRKILLNDVTD